MRSSGRSRSSPDAGAMEVGGAEEHVIDEAMRQRYAHDRGLSPFATWDEITAHDSDRRRARLDSLASPPAVASPAPGVSSPVPSSMTPDDSAAAARIAQRNVELELLVGRLQDELRESMQKVALLSSTFAQEKASLQEARLQEARQRLGAAAAVSERLEGVQRGVASLVDAVPIDQQEGLRTPATALEHSVDGLRTSLQEMVGAEQQLVADAEQAAAAAAVVVPDPAAAAPPAPGLEAAARSAGVAGDDALRRQQELVAVSGVSSARALELLGMADFDVNRAAEFHFTHPSGEEDASAEAAPAAAPVGTAEEVPLPLVQLLGGVDLQQQAPPPPPAADANDGFLLSLGASVTGAGINGGGGTTTPIEQDHYGGGGGGGGPGTRRIWADRI
eukprot:COSAG05_NODE_3923_length_1773_cov_0.903226_1_plen_389_part_10